VGHGLLTMVDGQFLVHDSCFLRHMHGKTWIWECNQIF
jgi:hypothetical protein